MTVRLLCFPSKKEYKNSNTGWRREEGAAADTERKRWGGPQRERMVQITQTGRSINMEEEAFSWHGVSNLTASRISTHKHTYMLRRCLWRLAVAMLRRGCTWLRTVNTQHVIVRIRGGLWCFLLQRCSMWPQSTSFIVTEGNTEAFIIPPPPPVDPKLLTQP